jgi:hypothetical protein
MRCCVRRTRCGVHRTLTLELEIVAMKIDLGYLILAIALAVVLYRWLKTRQLLYRITEKTDKILQCQGLTSLNLFKSNNMRRKLSLHTLAARLESKIDQLLESEIYTEEDKAHSKK